MTWWVIQFSYWSSDINHQIICLCVWHSACVAQAFQIWKKKKSIFEKLYETAIVCRILNWKSLHKLFPLSLFDNSSGNMLMAESDSWQLQWRSSEFLVLQTDSTLKHLIKSPMNFGFAFFQKSFFEAFKFRSFFLSLKKSTPFEESAFWFTMWSQAFIKERDHRVCSHWVKTIFVWTIWTGPGWGRPFKGF